MQMQSLPRVARRPRPTVRDWAGLFDDVPETDVAHVEVEGRLTCDLRGTLYRNGPGKQNFCSYHIEGDGLVRALAFREQGVRFRSRYVRTPKWLKERDSDRPRVRGVGYNLPGGMLRNAFSASGNEASTHIVCHGDELLALWEGGHPYRIQRDTLSTLGATDFDGLLRNSQAFSAHPHIDAQSGRLYNVGIELGPTTRLHTYVREPDRRVRRAATVDLPYATIVHDFALSERWVAVLVAPLVLDLWNALLGRKSFFDALQWKPGRGSQLILIPRDGGRQRVVALESIFSWHVANAYDDGAELVVDLVTHDDYAAIQRDMCDFRSSDFASNAGYALERLRIQTQDSRVQRQAICALPMEFPQVHPRVVARPHRYLYTAANGHNDTPGWFRGLLKCDVQTGVTDYFEFDGHRTVQEPVFAPRPGSAEEDDGWLLAYVHDAARGATDVVVMDARRLADGPVATLHLPHNEGLTFHGTWQPRG